MATRAQVAFVFVCEQRLTARFGGKQRRRSIRVCFLSTHKSRHEGCSLVLAEVIKAYNPHLVVVARTTEGNGKVVAILLVTEDAKTVLISQYGKIIRTSTDSIREAGHLLGRSCCGSVSERLSTPVHSAAVCAAVTTDGS